MEKLNSLKKEVFRFRLMLGSPTKTGFERTKTVGMAYLTEGSHSYSLKLWTFPREKFSLVPKRAEQGKFLVFIRDENKVRAGNNRSNIVGNGEVLSTAGVLRIDFDLFDKPVFMSIFPEPTVKANQANVLQEVQDEAA